MNVFIESYSNVVILLGLLIGYLVGSLSWGIIISRVFFKVDLRQLGSKNSGGSNAGRVLGKKIGMLVIVLDAFKTIISILLTILLLSIIMGQEPEVVRGGILLSALGAIIGHCYPLYYKFKGGKAVAIALGLSISTNWIIFLLVILMFFITLKIWKYVSLSSIIVTLFGAILSFIPFVQDYGMYPYLDYGYDYSLVIVVLAILMIIRHRQNIIRIIKKEESKVKWL